MTFQEQTNQYVQQIKAGANSILVAVRVRPLSQKQRKISTFQTVKVLEGKLLSLIEPQSWSPVDVLRKNRSKQIQYAFDFVFDQQIRTKTIYEQTVSILLQGLLQGYNASVLAYGATSCGKTYTMVGENENAPGIMAMTVLQLLNIANQAKKYQDIKLKASYIEIYNQNVKDLLISEDRNLQIRQDPKEGVTIAGVTQVAVQNINQLKTVLKVGNKNRTMESTGSNQVSSRSHGIFEIKVQVKNKAQSTVDETILSKLFLIDLAGSQRASNTTNKGLRMVEGAKINQSLLVLGNCIQALSDASEKGLKNAFVPYRGSKLTRLLKDSLGGNCRTLMIAHIAPASNLFEETYNTLVYAHRAKNIKNNPIRNTLVADTHLSNYVNVINNLKKQNQELKNQIKIKQLNERQKQKNSPYKNNYSLPLIQNSAYNQQISKYESIILKQFSDEDTLLQKISDIQMKLQQLAFSIFEKQLFKSDEKSIKIKSAEAAELSKEKIKLQRKYQQKVQTRNKIIRQIQKNQILGSIGQSSLKNTFKQKKVQSALKMLKQKQDLIAEQRKQLDIIIKKIKSSLKNRENIIQKQNLLIKKNNIISRITYSNLDQKVMDDNLSVKSEKKSIQKPKNKQIGPTLKKLQIPITKTIQTHIDHGNSFQLYTGKKQGIQKQINHPKQKISGNKLTKVARSVQINETKNANIVSIQRTGQQSDRIGQKLQRNMSENLKNKKSKPLLKKAQTKKQSKFDFVYMPH